MIKNKKNILILVISLVILYLVISIIYIIPKGKKYNNTVFLGSVTKVNIKNGVIRLYNEDKKILKQDIKIYFKGKFVDGYLLSDEMESTGVNNNYCVYNKEGKYLYPKDVLIAHTPDISIKVKEGNTKPYNTNSDIEELYNNINISEDLELNTLTIVNIDIDDDGTDEYIYSVGLIRYNESEDMTYEYDDEIEEIEINDQEYVSMVYLKKGDKYILISKSESEYDSTSYVELSFIKLIDFNNDDNYEFVIEKNMSDYGPYYYELYNFDGNKFTKIGGE